MKKQPRKKRSSVPRGYIPFPILKAKTTFAAGNKQYESARFVCKGELQDDCSVIVRCPGDIAFLYQMGFYGQGSLSKHEPIFDEIVEMETVDNIEKHLQSLSMERYTCSLHTAVNAAPLHTERVTPARGALLVKLDLDKLQEHSHLDHPIVSPQMLPFVEMDRGGVGEEIEQTCPPRSPMDVEVDALQFTSQIESATEDSLRDNSMTDTWTYLTSSCVVDSEDWPTDDDFWESDNQPTTDSQLVTGSQPTTDSQLVTGRQPTTDSQLVTGRQPITDSQLVTGTQPITDSQLVTRRQPITDGQALASDVQNIEVGSPPLTKPVQAEDGGALDYDTDVTECDVIHDVYSSEDEWSNVTKESVPGAGEDKSKYLKSPEHLILDACEVVFLMLAFGCLLVEEPGNGEPVDLKRVWRQCIDKDKSFIPKYAVYHHIRAKGWVPKDGLTYGCDFMVYKKGPKYYHSSVGVIFRCCSWRTHEEKVEYNPRSFTWTKMMGLSRVLNNVKKELMVCHVLAPDEMTDHLIQSPDICLRSLTISETLLTRVVPSRERDSDPPSDGHNPKANVSTSRTKAQ